MPFFSDIGSRQFQTSNFDTQTEDGFDPILEDFSLHAKSRQHLLPKPSLSQYNLRQIYLNQVKPPNQVVYKPLPGEYASGASVQASVTTIHSQYLQPSRSTLRIQDSRQRLNCTPISSSDSQQKPCLGERGTRQNRMHRNKSRPLISTKPCHHIASPSPKIGPESLSEHRSEDPTLIIEHFKSFCVLDTAVEGCPVTATSGELRYIFDVGEHFFLNNQECEGKSMDVVTGYDSTGEPITHLVLFSPLISPGSGRSRFMLASLIDITQFLQETAELPDFVPSLKDVETASELSTPPRQRFESKWMSSHYGMELSAEDLLGGCYLKDDAYPIKASDDIWLNLATEEMSKKSYTSSLSGRSESQISSCQSWSNTTASSLSSSHVDEVLEKFIASLQELYSDFFILGRSPLEDNVYEICNVSPRVYTSKEYIEGHLSKTPQEDLNLLSDKIGQGDPFSMPVKWGIDGIDKSLHCGPLYGQSSITWVCFLVEERISMLR